jgi:hypothetical protein
MHQVWHKFHQELRGKGHQGHAETKQSHWELILLKEKAIDEKTNAFRMKANTCPVSKGVSAASFDATGLGERTGQVCM